MLSIIKKKRWTESTTSFTKKQKKQVDQILSEGLSPHKLDKDKNNLLHLAVICNEYSYVKTAIKIDKLKTEKNVQGYTPEDLAVMLGRQEILKLFRKEKKNTFKVEKNGKKYTLNQKEFEKFFQISFLPDLKFANISVLNWVVNRCNKAVKKNDMDREQKWLGKYYDSEIDSSHKADVTIKFISKMMGYGLFANKKIKKKALVAEYIGEVRKYNFNIDYKNAYCFEYLIADKFETPFIIDAKDQGNIARFVNHDSEGNIVPKAVYQKGIMRVVLQANRDIEIGEQLCYDYGPEYWAQREDPSEL